MKRCILGVVLLLLVAAVALAADDVPKMEVFGGYSIQRLGMPNIESLDLSELGYPVNFESSKFLKTGFNLAYTYNVSPALGIEADLRYNSGNILKGTLEVEGISVEAKGKYRDLSVLAGPRFSLRSKEAVTPFVHALVGFDHAKISAEGSALGQSMSVDAVKDTGLGFALGGGIDVNMKGGLAIRVVQADYYLTRHEGESWNNFSLAFGVVYRIGAKSK